MTDFEFWELAFCGIASIRLHPRNDENGTARQEVEFAASVADLMLEERRERWHGDR